MTNKKYSSLICLTILLVAATAQLLPVYARAQTRRAGQKLLWQDRNPDRFIFNDESRDGVSGLLQLSADGSKLLVGENSQHGIPLLRLIDTKSRRSKIVSRNSRIKLEDESVFESENPFGYIVSPLGSHALLSAFDRAGAKRLFLYDISKDRGVPLEPQRWFEENGVDARLTEIPSAHFAPDGDRVFFLADYSENLEFPIQIRVMSIFEYSLSSRTYRQVASSKSAPLLIESNSIEAVSSDSQSILLLGRVYHPDRLDVFVSAQVGDGSVKELMRRKTTGWPDFQGVWIENNGTRAIIHGQSTVDLEGSSNPIFKNQIFEINGGNSARALDCIEMHASWDSSPSSSSDGTLVALASKPYSRSEGDSSRGFIQVLNTRTNRCQPLTRSNGMSADISVTLTANGKQAAILQVIISASDNYIKKSLILRRR